VSYKITPSSPSSTRSSLKWEESSGYGIVVARRERRYGTGVDERGEWESREARRKERKGKERGKMGRVLQITWKREAGGRLKALTLCRRSVVRKGGRRGEIRRRGDEPVEEAWTLRRTRHRLRAAYVDEAKRGSSRQDEVKEEREGRDAPGAEASTSWVKVEVTVIDFSLPVKGRERVSPSSTS
jgi:hypothetical protein